MSSQRESCTRVPARLIGKAGSFVCEVLIWSLVPSSLIDATGSGRDLGEELGWVGVQGLR